MPIAIPVAVEVVSTVSSTTSAIIGIIPYQARQTASIAVLQPAAINPAGGATSARATTLLTVAAAATTNNAPSAASSSTDSLPARYCQRPVPRNSVVRMVPHPYSTPMIEAASTAIRITPMEEAGVSASVMGPGNVKFA